MKPAKIKIYTLPDCETCDLQCKAFDFYGINYLKIDASLPEHDKECDEYGIDTLPCIQVLDPDGNVISQDIGYLPPSRIVDVRTFNRTTDEDDCGCE